jgi:hypothetical protein
VSVAFQRKYDFRNLVKSTKYNAQPVFGNASLHSHALHGVVVRPVILPCASLVYNALHEAVQRFIILQTTGWCGLALQALQSAVCCTRAFVIRSSSAWCAFLAGQVPYGVVPRPRALLFCIALCLSAMRCTLWLPRGVIALRRMVR